MRDRPNPDMSLTDLSLYVSRKSKWAVTHRCDAEWFLTLQQEIRDKLRLGAVRAFGREGIQSAAKGFQPPLAPIDRDEWKNCRPEIFDGLMGNKTANKAYENGGKDKYFDIHFIRDEIESVWPKAWFPKPLNIRTDKQ